jgi:lipopolysaccharide transport system permease protein
MNMIVPDQGGFGSGVDGAVTGPGRVVHIAASRGWKETTKLAAADLQETVRLWPLVWTLSFFDIRLRYRGSMLGPFWLTLSTAIMVAAMGFLYAKLFHLDIGRYLPYLTISLVLWNFVNTLTSEGATCYTQAEGMIRAIRLPQSLHAARVVVRNVLVLAHNIAAVVVVFIVFRVVPNVDAFSLLPALLLWSADAFAMVVLLGVFGARFRDIPPIVGSVMQIVFYLTPIMWRADMLAARGGLVVFVTLNPFFALLEILRGPLLGEPINVEAWYVALAYSAGLMLLAGLVFVRARPRIPYWI